MKVTKTSLLWWWWYVLLWYVFFLYVTSVCASVVEASSDETHVLGSFVVQISGKRFTITENTQSNETNATDITSTTKNIMTPWLGLPTLKPLRIEEFGNPHDTTIRLRFEETDGYSSLASYEFVAQDSTSITYRLPVVGGCGGYIYLSFLSVSEKSLEVVVEHKDQHMFSFTACNALALQFAKQKHENFVGLGTQYTHLNLEGQRYASLSQEQGHGRGLEPLTWFSNKFLRGTGGDSTTSYHYVPHFLSRLGWSFWLYGIRHAYFDFTSESYVRIVNRGSKMHFRLNAAKDPKTLLQIFAQKFGTTKTLPEWVHRGAMMGLQGGEERIDTKMALLKHMGAKVSSLWVQDWIGSMNTFIGHRLVWQWRVDRSLYPNWEDFVTRYTAQGTPTLSYFNPRFVDRCETKCHYDLAMENDYLVKDKDGNVKLIKNGGFKFAKIDLSNMLARDWFISLMKEHTQKAPIKGWMADFSEALPFDAKMANGDWGKEFHQKYIYEWSKLNGEVIDEVEDGFVFVRSGALGSHRYVHGFWLGDQLSTWDKFDGLHSTIIGLISSGLSGALVNHSDIGGLTSLRIPLVANIRRSKELFLRWMQMNAFTPIFRTHEGLWPWDAHQFDSDEETLKEFARYSRIFAALFDYRKTLVEESQSLGLPMTRGLFLEYPDDPHAWMVDDQFMLGSDVMVAPILSPGTHSRIVYFPKGHWVEVFSGKDYIFKNPVFLEVKSTKNTIPVFAKSGSLAAKLLSEALQKEEW